jgi:hypothetical protein
MLRWCSLRTIAVAVATCLSLTSVTWHGSRAANGSVTYTYDALGRITSASYDTGVCLVYAYDANGNRTSEKILVVTGTTTGIWGCFNWNSGAKWGP